MKRRILTITVAVLLAAVGTVSVLVYVHQANNRAVAGLKAVSVIVAKGSIPSGTPAGQALRDGLLGSQTLPAGSVPVDAVRSVTPDLAGLVTSSPVQSGQLLTRAMLVAASQVTGGVAIPPGLVAVTIQMCLPEAVAGYVSAGAYVAVFDTYSKKSLDVQETCNASHQVQAAGAVVTSMVLPRVKVLSVGQAPASSQGASSGGTGALSAGCGQLRVISGCGNGDAGRPAGRCRAAHQSRRGGPALPGAAHAHIAHRIRYRHATPLIQLHP